MTFTLAHLSDPHLPMPPARAGELLGKRLTGYVNWWRGRVRLHRPEALAGIVADLKAAQPDHIAVTGDLVNISLPAEFRRAADWLTALGSPRDVTLVPGNHDVYVATRWPATLGLWGAWLAGDGAPSAASFDVFPTLRRRGPVALVGLSSGVPKPPFFASGTLGAAQLARAERLLADLGREGLCRVVLIHHPPLTTEKRMKRLTDAAAFQAMIRRVGCEIVLHGHNHRSELARIAGPTGPVPVLGVASASAAPDSKYGAARYHLIRISGEAGAWRLDVEMRALSPDGTGCTSDGHLIFLPDRERGGARPAMTDPIVVTPVDGKADLKAFIDLPKRLYAGHKGYVAHLDTERREAFSPKKNPLFKHVEVGFFLARRAGRVVGRITAQVDRAYLERYKDDTGHFGCLVAEDDPAIFAALVAAAEQWLRARSMKRVTGPFSLSVNEEVGLQVWGFDSRPMLLVPYDPPYAGGRVEQCGFAKIKDVFSYDYDVQNAPETIGAKLLARAGFAGRVRARTANMKMFDAEVRTLVGIFNDAWSDNWGFVPFTQAEIDHAAKAFGPVIVPELAVFVEVDDEAVAFIVALTNLSEAVAEFNGGLSPVNLLKLVWRMRFAGVGSTRVPLMGVKKKYRNHPLMGAGLAMMAIDHLRANGKRLGKTSAELGWILEDNKATNNIIRSVGGVHYKTHRIYEKMLG